MQTTLRRSLLVVLGIAVVLGFAANGARGLYETTEGRYAESAREMVETGDYLQPQLAYHSHLTKPPLAYWAIAAGLQLFGSNEFGARACNGLGFVISVLAVMGIASLLWERKTGVVAGLIYATSLLAVGGASSLSTDTLVTTFELLAVLSWLKAVKSPGSGREQLFIVLAWVAIGFGILTKGPAALVPLAPILGYDLLAGRPFRMVSPLGIGLCLALGLSWYVAIGLRLPGTLDFVVEQQLTGRLFANDFNRNDEWYQPFRIYLPLVAFGCGPWIWFAIAAWRKRPETRPRALLASWRAATPANFLALWIVPPLVVFSLAQSRLPLYVLPLCAPVAIGLARAVALLSPDPLRRATRLAVPLAAILLAGLYYTSSREHPNDMRALYRAVSAAAGPGARVYSYEEEFLHGLRFYLGGKLTRLASDSQAAFADEPLEQALDEVGNGAAVFVTKNRRAAAIAARLSAHGIHFRRVQAGAWTLLVTGSGGARHLAEAPTP